ncbi:MAG: hypothetical protein IPL83_00905 [Bdellovibrionales bacterium]|nr:hypothetical protein [Bdellovibrionales bacterium]
MSTRRSSHVNIHHFGCTEFYDAFISNESRAWNESNLISFFIQFADVPRVLSTYAATGSLERAPKRATFKVEFVPGFGGKRHSTTAMRDRHY